MSVNWLLLSQANSTLLRLTSILYWPY